MASALANIVKGRSGVVGGGGGGGNVFREIKFEKTPAPTTTTTTMHHQLGSGADAEAGINDDDGDDDEDVVGERVDISTVPEIFTTAQQLRDKQRQQHGNPAARDFYIYGMWSLPMVALLFGVDVCLNPNVAAGVALTLLIMLLRVRSVVSETSERGREVRAGWKLLVTWSGVLLASAVACSVSKLHPRAWDGVVTCQQPEPPKDTWSPTTAPVAPATTVVPTVPGN